MQKPLVSIILTLYEIKLDYLNECLNSLLQQSYQDIEIICINDASPTIDYDSITSLSDKIHLYKNETNLGMNKSVNKAFSLAKGKYIVRLGSDDIFHKDLIKEEVEFLENNETIGAVCCELERFGKAYQHITRPKIWDFTEIVINRKLAGTGYAGGMMFRRALLKTCAIDESLKMCEDFDFHLQILKQMPIASIHKILYYYRSHDTNLCKKVKKEERWTLIDKILSKYNK
jgi:glycosyltransferase involved in cell wall biosynthesis